MSSLYDDVWADADIDYRTNGYDPRDMDEPEDDGDVLVHDPNRDGLGVDFPDDEDEEEEDNLEDEDEEE